MFENINAAYLQVITLLSFGISVVAAVLAIDMYRLLRTGEFGHSWRILIIASVMFALTLALRLAEHFQWRDLQRVQLSRYGELMFALSLAYAFYLQRRAFSSPKDHREEVAPPRSATTSGQRDLEDLEDLAKYYAEGGSNAPQSPDHRAFNR
jgi:hypothetical protein